MSSAAVVIVSLRVKMTWSPEPNHGITIAYHPHLYALLSMRSIKQKFAFSSKGGKCYPISYAAFIITG